MAQNEPPLLLRSNLKALRLPTMLAEHGKLAGEAADSNQDYLDYLLRLTELELATRSANALQARIKQAGFPVHKDLEAFDFSAAPGLSKPKILELARGGWIDQRQNCCLLGEFGNWQDAHGDRLGTGGVPAGQARAVLHGGRPGQSFGGSAEAIPA